MIKSQRTKRRKIRNDLATFNVSEIYPRIELISTDDEFITREPIPCQSFQNNDALVLSTEVEPVISHHLSLPPIFTGPEIVDQPESEKIKDFIASWAIQYKIPHNALRTSSGLKKDECFQSLPLDARTILCTI